MGELGDSKNLLGIYLRFDYTEWPVPQQDEYRWNVDRPTLYF